MIEQEWGKQVYKERVGGGDPAYIQASLQGTKRGKLPCKVVILLFQHFLLIPLA